MMKKLATMILAMMMLFGACAQADYLLGAAAKDAGDIVLPLMLCMEAAEQGDAESAYELGCMYYLGEGVEPDDAAAMEWYLKAAERGITSAMHLIGDMYFQGMGVEADAKLDQEWYDKAIENGYNPNH